MEHHTGVLVDTYFNGVFILDIDSPYLEEGYEEVIQQELFEYPQELTRAFSLS